MKLSDKYFEEFSNEFENNLLKQWYPLVIDQEYGGYFSNISNDWKVKNVQNKMIVTQARHIWVLSKAYELYKDEKYIDMAEHGLAFLKNYMWDSKHGGFYQIRSRNGWTTNAENWLNEKRVYGNAFAIYGLSALYGATQNNEALDLAKDTFWWIEKHSHDKIHKGYFQFLTEEGKPFDKNSNYKSSATDHKEVGYKDQNSSIHLLEAFTELYKVWKDPLLKERLTELLILIRDTITTQKGHLNLFFERDWTPVSFKNSSPKVKEKNYCLDHVSFGHDYETAFLMLEASYILDFENDNKTLSICRKMLEHSIKNGWDKDNYGFYDEGYYLNENQCDIIKDTKTWWPQAEGLNALLIFSKIFPNDKQYKEMFINLWTYIKEFVIDNKNKGWYWGSLEKEPYMKNENKGSIWKCSYHDGRSLINCLFVLYDNNKDITIGYKKNIEHMNDFLNHWENIANKMLMEEVIE